MARSKPSFVELMLDIEKYNRRVRWNQTPYWKKREYQWKRQGINFAWSQFLTMLEQQSNQCAICTRGIDEKTAYLDHANGQARGLLCANCNHLLGRAYDSVGILQAAISYLSST